MEENSTPNPIEPIVETSTQQSTPPSGIKTSLLVLMSILVILTTAIAGFFAWQTQRLTKQLSSYQNQETPSPTPTKDPTENWNKYNDPVYSYTIKYPENWVLIPTPTQGVGGLASFSGDEKKFEIGRDLTKLKDEESLRDYFTRTQTGVREIISQGEYELKHINVLKTILPITQGDGAFKYGIHYLFKNNFGEVMFAEFYTQDYVNDLSLADSIMSTFKLTAAPIETPKATATSKSIMCTQEAKLCPDGSYVGRTGPNCEFADCP